MDPAPHARGVPLCRNGVSVPRPGSSTSFPLPPSQHPWCSVRVFGLVAANVAHVSLHHEDGTTGTIVPTGLDPCEEPKSYGYGVKQCP